MKLKPYSEYKDSGVLWLGKVPSHWEVRKTKYLFSERVQKGYPDEPLLAATQTKGVVPKTHYESRTVVAQKDLHLLKFAKQGDFVISLRSFQGGIEYAYFQGIISPAYTIMTPSKDIKSTYFKHFFKSKPFIELLRTCVTGIREGQNIDYEILGRSILPLPSQEEQNYIGQFLQAKSAQISRFIRNKRRLIELLKEQKQAIINQAVTHGIDPNVRLKPSGVEWLGDIPEHWEVRRLRTIASVKPSGVDKNSIENEQPVLLCNYVDVYKNEVITNKIDFMKATATQDEIRAFELKAGDVVITKDSESWDDIAVPAFVPETLPGVVCAYHLAIVRPNTKLIDGEFLFRAFSSDPIADQFRVSANGVTRYGLAQGAIKSAYFPFPPKEEQRKIIEFISEKSSEIHAAISHAEREIELMREYRKRLIADVVTGKVDVRDVPVETVPQGLEELEEPTESEEMEEAFGEKEEIQDADE